VEEALSALITLGFAKNQSEKTLSQIIKEAGGEMQPNPWLEPLCAFYLPE
jgi:Holliday junction resolvasome RuvABC DNA-binding subunit